MGGLTINVGKDQNVTLQGSSSSQGKISTKSHYYEGAISAYKIGLLTIQDLIIDSPYRNGIYINNYPKRGENYFSSLVVKGGTITSRRAAIQTQSAGDITILGANLTGRGYRGEISASIELINTRSLTVSDTIIKGEYVGILVREADRYQRFNTRVMISGNTKIIPIEDTEQFVAIGFVDLKYNNDDNRKPPLMRNVLDLATDPNNIQGLVASAAYYKYEPFKSGYILRNTNTLSLNGDNDLSLNLSEFGINEKDLKIRASDYSIIEQLTPGKKFFAFDTIEKNGSGIWTLSGTLAEGIITGHEEEYRKYTDYIPNNFQDITIPASPAFSINEGKIALAPNTIVHTDIVVNPNGTLYSQAGGKQRVDSLTIKGTYQVDVNSHSDYSQLHSAKDIVIDDGSKLYVYADKLQGGDDTFLNVLSTDGGLKGRFNPKIEDNSILFDFTAIYDPQAMHLNVKARPGLIEHLVKQQACDDCLIPVAVSLDKIKASADNDIAFGLIKLTSEKEVVKAVEQLQPLLGIRTSRVIIEATDTLTKAIPTGRCLVDTDENQVWAKALGEWNERDGSFGLSGYQANHYGIAVGNERCVTENTKLGLTAGYIKTDADSYDSSANHNLKADTWQVGVYGNTVLTPQWDIDFYAGVGQSYLDGKRRLTFLERTAESEMKANHFRTGITLNREFQINPQTKVTPFLTLDYQRVEVEDYIEKGAKDFDFAVDKQSTEAFIVKAGIKGDFQVNDRLSLQTKAAVGYDMTYRGNYLRAGFVNYPQYRFTLDDCDVSRVIGELNVGAKYQISKNIALSTGVQSTFAKGFNSVSGNVNLAIQF
ncbi:autotransporter domain-containing protein [Avibacterium paragallinarum]|uniref:autotransporter outer membrane beta-barrel domain-containing protein n=1 Tax=Avibacterium paragallinarum TaxID=728 RepID=UPI003978C82F